MDAKRLYEMELFEYEVHNSLGITRVPGGWIFGQTFVPYSDEFKPKTEKKKVEKSDYYPIGYMGVNFEIPKQMPEGISLVRYAYRRYFNENGRPKDLQDIAKDFLDYWETKDKSGKMAFEKEPKFNLPLRIKTWKQNNQNNNKNNGSTDTIPSVRRTEI